MEADLVGTSDGSRLAPRRELNEFAPVRAEVLHCYGVDALAHAQVLEVFQADQPKTVEWLDDSSCNVVFGSADAAQEAIRRLAMGEAQDSWVHTKPLNVKPHNKKGMRPQDVPKDFVLELRAATEADIKNPGHSGHFDSVFYAQEKERQRLEKVVQEQQKTREEAEAGMDPARSKKRQKYARFREEAQKKAAARQEEKRSRAASKDGSMDICLEAPKDATASDALPGPLSKRLGAGGLLDPLLYLHAAGSKARATLPGEEGDGSAEGAAKPGAAPGPEAKQEDLASVLKRQEAEYAAMPGVAGDAAATGAKGGRGRPGAKGQGRGEGKGARPRARTPGRPEQAGGKPGEQQQQQRGRKRRPVDQEPRAVAEGAEPPKRGPRVFKCVEDFFTKHRVRHQRVTLTKTFRHIMMRKNEARKEQKDKEGEAVEGKAADGEIKPAVALEATAEKAKTGEEKPSASALAVDPSLQALPPWDQYMGYNRSFTKLGHFMHTVAWQAKGQTILAIVPHQTRVELDKLARAVQRPVAEVKQRRLKEIQTETGFPNFVCLPFGWPKDKEGKAPVILVDSSVCEFRKPMLFDCGTVGISVPVSEFLRSTGAACVEGLGKEAKPEPPSEAKPAAGSGAGALHVASPEPAPEPAPATAPSQAPAAASDQTPVAMEM